MLRWEHKSEATIQEQEYNLALNTHYSDIDNIINQITAVPNKNFCNLAEHE